MIGGAFILSSIVSVSVESWIEVGLSGYTIRKEAIENHPHSHIQWAPLATSLGSKAPQEYTVQKQYNGSLLAWMVTCRTLNIHGIFPLHKRFFTVEKGYSEYAPHKNGSLMASLWKSLLEPWFLRVFGMEYISLHVRGSMWWHAEWNKHPPSGTLRSSTPSQVGL